MSNKLKLAFLAALVATGISSQVLAAKHPDGRHAYGMVTPGLNAYARVLHRDLNSPQFDGGGSNGYDAHLGAGNS